MALFFDQDWFDDRLKASGLSRAGLAQAAGMSIDEIERVFRDQRELELGEVQAVARALSLSPREVADRSGLPSGAGEALSGAVSNGGSGLGAGDGQATFAMTRDMVAGLHERMDRLEQLLEMVLRRLDRQR